MCGIAGIINLDRSVKPVVANLYAMTKSLRNRGPDDEGYLLIDPDNNPTIHFGSDTAASSLDYFNNSFYLPIKEKVKQPVRLAFGHRRLKIIDLSPTAFQPMSRQNGDLWLIYNGEIFNYKEIRNELEDKGFIFKSYSDSEVILNAYLALGPEFLHKLNGMFAFAIFDRKKNIVFLARDRVGIKPLFYTIQNNRFIFGSDIKSIIASGLYKPEINFTGLYNNLTLSVSPGVITSFKDIFWLEQGTWMEINLNNGSISTHQYWDVPVGIQDFSLSFEDSLQMLAHKIREAVRYSLVADVEVGTLMSGGVDSTLVTTIASEFKPEIKAFTLGFEPPLPDEVREAKENALGIDVTHLVKIASIDELIQGIKDVILCYEEPYVTLSPTYFISKFIKQHRVPVVLNGLGGDELFAGYRFYSKYLTIQKAKKIHWLLKLIPDFNERFKKLKKFTGFKDVGTYYAFTQSNFKDYDLTKIVSALDYNPITSFVTYYNIKDKKFTDFVEELSYYDIKWYIGKHQTYRADQFLMKFSIEGRFPLLDHNLIETVARIPSKYKIRNRQQKYILKKVAEKYMPKECIYRPKKGFSTPVLQLMDEQLKDFCNENFIKLRKREIFIDSGLEELYKNFHNNKQKIWQLVLTELWLQYFFDKGIIQVY